MAKETRPEFITEADNWYGVLDPKERKKIQDRLAQRARRRRLAEAKEARDPLSKAIARKRKGRLAATFDEDDTFDEDEILARATNRAMESLQDMVEDVKIARRHFLITQRCFSTGDNDPATQHIDYGLLQAFESSEDSDGLGCTDSVCGGGVDGIGCDHDPFTPILRAISATPPEPATDPFFLSMPAITVYAALWHNGQAMGIRCEPTATRHVNDPRQALPAGGVPADLRPTPLQLSTSHMTWIDRFPFADFRNNMIRYTNAGLVDAEEFMRDVFLMRSFTILPGCSSWDAKSWRLTPEFGAKWGFVFL